VLTKGLVAFTPAQGVVLAVTAFGVLWFGVFPGDL